jgi:geranial dehydrogenase
VNLQLEHRRMTVQKDSFFIGNEWVAPASDKRFTLVNASTEEVIGSVPEGVEADIDHAVSAARNAFDSREWADAAPADRAEVMERLTAALASRGDDIARTVSAQNGMPLAVSQPLEGQFSVCVLPY